VKIELARYSGFCMGVRDAVLKIVRELNKTHEKILVYGPLIHNPQTVEILGRRGLSTIRTLDGIDGKLVAIRTHGVPVELFREIRSRSRRYINLTCPRVSRVQGLIKSHSAKGYFTIIIGDAEHAEVMGLKSYATSGVAVIKGIDAMSSIPPAPKYIVVSQTTQDIEQFNNVAGELRKRFAGIIIFNTICDSTCSRQNDILAGIGKGIDALVVVGGKESANTLRLAGMGREHRLRTFHVETEAELKEGDFRQVDHVLVTAGASTPGWIINNVMEKLHDPLVHIIRNCIDHGIEQPDARIAAGKPRQGTILLSAEHAGAHVLIRIRDDGGGMNTEAIRRKAVAQGLISADAGLTDQELFTLVLLPGFSTADKVTDVSGRGVGMDVVKQTIDALRGTIEISSRNSDSQFVREKHWRPSKKKWKKILALPGAAGGRVHWRVVGTRDDKSTAMSEPTFLVMEGALPAGEPGIAAAGGGSGPTLSWRNNCNTKFKVWFGTDADFTRRGMKKKAFSVRDPDPRGAGGVCTMTLSAKQWVAIEKLVGGQAGATIYWYVESWDGLKRHAQTAVMPLTLPD